MKCKYEGSGVWEGRCTGTRELDPCPGHSKCSRFCGIYQTNADCIRSMSDEELAEFLAEEAFRIAKPVFDAFGWGVKKQVVCSQKLKWLKQPAEGDA